MPTDPTREKWERRRARRRAQPAPELASEEQPAEVERPWCVDRAFIIWMLIGVPTAIALVGIVIIAAALAMRAGSHGGRVVLTLIGSSSFVTPFLLAQAGFPAWFAVLVLVPCAMVMWATVLMWRRESSEYFAWR